MAHFEAISLGLFMILDNQISFAMDTSKTWVVY